MSWAGLWLALPFVERAIGLGLFVLLALACLLPLVRFRWPSREEGLNRLDRGTSVRHRPAMLERLEHRYDLWVSPSPAD